jgi:Ca2+-binding RTX toxin-like protein
VLDAGTDRDVLKGGEGNDMLVGGGGADLIDGGTGRDMLMGGSGADNLAGGLGRDMLKGGTGDDHLMGGEGNDVLVGGTGADVFVFASSSGHDRITDFGAADRIEIDGSLWSGTAADFVTDHASVTAQGVLISLSADSDILLLSLTRTDGLAEALQFG